jgi:hypothetical protein
MGFTVSNPQTLPYYFVKHKIDNQKLSTKKLDNPLDNPIPDKKQGLFTPFWSLYDNSNFQLYFYVSIICNGFLFVRTSGQNGFISFFQKYLPNYLISVFFPILFK